jgi:hypothetical protein
MALVGLTGWLSEQPGREGKAETLYREAADAGDVVALTDLAEWLRTRPGRMAEVETIYRESVAAGDPARSSDSSGG